MSLDVEKPRPTLQTDSRESSQTVFRRNDFELITGQSNPGLASQIAEILEHKLDSPITLFKDGEVDVKISRNLRRKHAVLIQSTSPPHVNDYYMELFMMVDAARRASADEITAVLPYFGYSRKDRKDQPRVALSASAVANILVGLGVDRVLTVDIHAEQAQGYILQPWDNLHASYALVPRIAPQVDKNNLVIIAPDFGAATRARKYAAAFGLLAIGMVYKERDVKPNSKSNSMFFIGDVKDKDVVIVDDILNTGSTMCDGATMLEANGARRIFAAVTHGVFSDDALERISASPIQKVYVTDSINQREEVRNHPKIEIVSLAPLLAEAIQRVHTGEGLTSLFQH